MKFKLIFLSFLFCMSLSAKRTDEGEALFNSKQYSKARTVYAALLKQRPNDALYHFRYARCCYELKDLEDAIVHFEVSGSKFPARNLYLGELYFDTYRFDQSVTVYQTYISTLKPDDSKISEYQQNLKRAENAARLMVRIEDIVIVDSVVVNKSDFIHYYKFSSELGSISQESLKLSARHVVDKIKYITQRQDRVYYSDSIHGQMDIFSSYKLLDSWSVPMPLSNLINTKANENYPFLLLDGVTVYFASDGENSIGGYDLFITRYNPSTDTYLTPENIGFPFNSPANDYMMVIDEQRQLGWFATDRNQSAGKVMIYTFVPNQAKVIIRSEDKDYLRRAAQLKTYRKGVKIVADTTFAFQEQVKKTKNQIEFVINDSIVYTDVKDFKSEEALKLWNELHALTVNLNAKASELKTLRGGYDQIQGDEEKALTISKIRQLEAENIDLKKQIQIRTIQVRNEENKFLRGLK
jgi:tetratricopeptide (TPR) repeat protein